MRMVDGPEREVERGLVLADVVLQRHRVSLHPRAGGQLMEGRPRPGVHHASRIQRDSSPEE